MDSFNKYINGILGAISQTKLFGWLPLDMLMHSILGALIAITTQIFTKSAWKAFFVCLGAALLKELYDSTSLVASWSEAIKDIVITMIYPSFLVVVVFIKKKLDREDEY